MSNIDHTVEVEEKIFADSDQSTVFDVESTLVVIFVAVVFCRIPLVNVIVTDAQFIGDVEFGITSGDSNNSLLQGRAVLRRSEGVELPFDSDIGKGKTDMGLP